jgi:threonine synthase
MYQKSIQLVHESYKERIVKFHSTNDETHIVNFREALLTGQPPDKGLYVPTKLIQMEPTFWISLEQRSFQEISLKVAEKLFSDEIPEDVLERIVKKAFPFSPKLKQLNTHTHTLELYHGPTFAFKDFGARFMAFTTSYLLEGSNSDLTIIVATSGDTGSAVANAFHNVPKIRVVILYPSGGVSILQEKQLTTLGNNVSALEVAGTFDDCQRLAKQALADQQLNRKVKLSSANSINVGRLFPQSFYYIYAQVQLDKPVIFSVPSGNFGNLTAGLYASKMGLPVARFITATNVNDTVPQYLLTSKFLPQKSIKTMSNAMDVGNPSNFIRMLELYEYNADNMRAEIWGTSVNDSVTSQVIRQVNEEFNYQIDPHTAVGYEGLVRFRKTHPELNSTPAIVISTAHPAKFKDVVETILDRTIEMPESLKITSNLEKTSIQIGANYEELKDFLVTM